MAVIDLNAKRKARAAKRENTEPNQVKFGTSKFDLPPELPAEFAFAASEGDLRRALRSLFGDRAEEFFAGDPSFDDVKELTEAIASMYGFDDVGESAPSEPSS